VEEVVVGEVATIILTLGFSAAYPAERYLTVLVRANHPVFNN